jgi:hypothetical protein
MTCVWQHGAEHARVHDDPIEFVHEALGDGRKARLLRPMRDAAAKKHAADKSIAPRDCSVER